MLKSKGAEMSEADFLQQMTSQAVTRAFQFQDNDAKLFCVADI
jgi:hypothetical protein